MSFVFRSSNSFDDENEWWKLDKVFITRCLLWSGKNKFLFNIKFYKTFEFFSLILCTVLVWPTMFVGLPRTLLDFGISWFKFQGKKELTERIFQDNFDATNVSLFWMPTRVFIRNSLYETQSLEWQGSYETPVLAKILT